MSDINDRLNDEDIEISRRDVRERVTDIVYTNSEAADGEVLQYNSSTGLFNSVTPSAAGLYIEGGTDLPVTDGGTGASTASDARTNLGIGSIATQDANAVAITGGTVSGLTTLGASAAAITGGTISGVTFSSSAATITGGTISGITDLAVADGGTGASTHTSGAILKGNGTSAWTAATEGVDYWKPGGTDVAVADGGTGTSSATAYAVLCGGTTSTGAFQSISSVGTANQVLTSNGAGALPTFQAAPTYPGQYYDFISSQTASSSASISFTGLSSTYKEYILFLTDIFPAANGGNLYMRCSTDGGSSYDSTLDIYEFSYKFVAGGARGAGGVIVNSTAARLLYQGSLDTTSTSNLLYIIRISNPSQTSVYKIIETMAAQYDSGSGGIINTQEAAVYKNTAAVDAIQFAMSSGNIASGVFTLYGVKNS